MSEVFNYCHVAELTDKGCKRQANEDWLAHFESPNGLVAVVCDGMGGHVGGQIASHTAVETIQQFMMQERSGTPGQLIVEAMNVANAAILNRAAQQPELTGMGSTCVMLIVRNGKVYIGSVGDSRVYLIRNHRIRQLTIDQSYVQMLVAAGSITPEEAEHHPRKNEITNALGLKGMQPATVLPDAINPEAGDCFLLCSDGLSGMVSDKDIEKVVSQQSSKTQHKRVEELVMRAKQNGGLDNITCQIVEFSVNPNAKDIQPWWKKNFWLLVGIAGTICLAIVAAICFFVLWEGKEDEPPYSEEVKSLIATSDSVFSLPPVSFAKTKVFGELTNSFNGSKLVFHCADRDTTIMVPFFLERLDVTPEASIKVEYDNDSANCRLSFEKELDSENVIGITIHGAKTYLYLLPLEQKAKSSTQAMTSESGARKSGVVEEHEYEEAGEESTDDEKDSEVSQTDVQIEIAKNQQNQVITLYSKEGTNTNSKLFFKEFAFLIDTNLDMNWYTIQNNGSECNITIINTKEKPIPSDAVITIPTRPKPDNGEGIILRIKSK